MKRRGFLKLLGIGAAATQISPIAAKPEVPAITTGYAQRLPITKGDVMTATSCFSVMAVSSPARWTDCSWPTGKASNKQEIG